MAQLASASVTLLLAPEDTVRQTLEAYLRLIAKRWCCRLSCLLRQEEFVSHLLRLGGKSGHRSSALSLTASTLGNLRHLEWRSSMQSILRADCRFRTQMMTALAMAWRYLRLRSRRASEHRRTSRNCRYRRRDINCTIDPSFQPTLMYAPHNQIGLTDDQGTGGMQAWRFKTPRLVISFCTKRLPHNAMTLRHSIGDFQFFPYNLLRHA
jgi:hypothetical protein